MASHSWNELRSRMNVSDEALHRANKELVKRIQLYDLIMALPRNIFIVDVRDA